MLVFWHFLLDKKKRPARKIMVPGINKCDITLRRWSYIVKVCLKMGLIQIVATVKFHLTTYMGFISWDNKCFYYPYSYIWHFVSNVVHKLSAIDVFNTVPTKYSSGVQEAKADNTSWTTQDRFKYFVNGSGGWKLLEVAVIIVVRCGNQISLFS